MSEASEVNPDEKTFEERHPEVAGIPAESFPKTLIFNIGDMPIMQYRALLDSAFAQVLEYSDSPVGDIVILVNAVSETNRAYLTNFLEGAIGARTADFRRARTGVVWKGDKAKLSVRAQENIARAEEQTATDRRANLLISFGGESLTGSSVSIDPRETLITDSTSGKTYKQTVFTSAGIDSVVLAFSLSQPVAA